METGKPLSDKFANKGTEDIFNGKATKRARKALPEHLWGKAQLKMEALFAATWLDELRIPPSNNLHTLKEDRAGQHAVKINKQYRVCFKWTEAGATEVEVTDYH